MQAEIIHVGANTVLICALQMSTVLRIPKIPRVVLGQELSWYGNYSSPHTDPSAVTALRCAGCFVFFREGAAKFSGNRPLLQILCKQNFMVSGQRGSEDLQGKSQQLLPGSLFVPEQHTRISRCLGFAQGCSWCSGMGSVPGPGRISRLEPSPGGKGSSGSWRAREGQRDGHVLLHPRFGGATGVRSSLARLARGTQGCSAKATPDLLFLSLWIIHRGAEGVRSVQAVFVPHRLLLAAGNVLSCPESPGHFQHLPWDWALERWDRDHPPLCELIQRLPELPQQIPSAAVTEGFLQPVGLSKQQLPGRTFGSEVLARGLQDLQQAGGEAGGRGDTEGTGTAAGPGAL